MSYDDTSDSNSRWQSTISRRQALAGLGAAGVFGVLGPGSLASAQDDSLSKRQAQWTARRRERLSHTTSQQPFIDANEDFGLDLPALEADRWGFTDTPESVIEDTVQNSVGDREIPLDSVDVTSQLHYLGAQWDEYSNPSPDTGDDGAWKHTFALSTVGAAQRLDPEATWTDAGDVDGSSATYLQYGPHPKLTLQPALRVMATSNAEYDEILEPFGEQSHSPDEDPPDHTEPGQGQEHVAISARRDPNLFGFGGPEALEEMVAGESAMQRLTNEMATIPTTAVADYGAIRRATARTEELEADVTSMARILGGMNGIASAAGDTLGSGQLGSTADLVDGDADSLGPLLGAPRSGSFGDNVLDKLEVITDVTVAVLEILDGPSYDKTAREFYHGFEQALEAAGPYSMGYVLFDVYVAPGKTGRVDVSAGTQIAFEERPQWPDDLENHPSSVQTWRLEFEGPPPEPEIGELSPGQLFSAEIVDADFSTFYPEALADYAGILPLTHQQRSERPGPTIVPTIDADDSDAADDGTSEEVVSGDQPTFSAHDTTLSKGPITSYEWSIHSLYESEDGDGSLEARPAYASLSGEVPTFSPTIEAPGDDDVAVQRVRLTVSSDPASETSEPASASTSFDFAVGEVEPPEPSAAVTPDPATVADTVTFAVDVDMPGEAVTVGWRVTEHPPALDHAPEYVLEGSGQEFAFDPPVAGSYEATVVVTDDLETRSTASVSLTVTPFTVDITGPDHLEPGAEASFEASVDGDADVTGYEWQVFGEELAGSTVSATYGSGDDPTVSVTATGSNGSTVSDAIELPVHDMDVTLEGPSTLDVEETATVEASVSGAETEVHYVFDSATAADALPDDASPDDSSRLVSFDSTGEQTISVSAEETDGDVVETASAAISIEVVDGSEPVPIAGPTTVSVDETVSYEVSTADLDDDLAFDWQAFGRSHTGPSVTGSFEEPGEHIVTVVASDPDGSHPNRSGRLTVWVSEPPELSIDGPTTVSITDSVTYEVAEVDADATYEWDAFGEHDSGPSVTGTFPDIGTQTVRLSATVDGDEKEVTRTITVQPEPIGEDGPVPTDPDGDGLYEDVNGDGSLSNGDVVDFFGNQHTPAWDERVDLFDFTGDSDVSQADVVELFWKVTGDS